MNTPINMMDIQLERAIRENKSLAEMIAEQLVMEAAAPGLDKSRSTILKLKRNLCVPVCEIIATNDLDLIAQAGKEMAVALSLMALTSTSPELHIDIISAHAKDRVAESAECHRRMISRGMTIGTKLGDTAARR